MYNEHGQQEYIYVQCTQTTRIYMYNEHGQQEYICTMKTDNKNIYVQ